MRLELTGRTELAIRALRELSSRGDEDVTRGEELALATGTTKNYIPQVMSPLVQAGWVKSTTGPTGGYALATTTAEISLLQVIEAVEGPADDGQCVLKGTPCPDQGPCAMHEPWSRARSALLNELAGTPVAEVRRGVPNKEGSDA
jgi:Rrf2 family protein